MIDRTSKIFNNPMSQKTIKQAQKSKRKYIQKFGDDSNADYKIAFKDIPTLDFLNAKNIVFSDHQEAFPENALIVGNIRMGFGHYRISIAIASCAKALGYQPIWLDLASFDATGSKMIRQQNDLYSMASRISQKSKLFNHFFWEPLNCEGFKKISYNAKDQKNSELLVPIFKNIPKDIPYVATHVWPSQGAIHSQMSHVVNAIPDNWPMGLHLSQGAIHTVQTPFAYLGYKTLNGFDQKRLHGMPDESLKMVGHYVDHEMLVHLKQDNEERLTRITQQKPLRLLLTVGGAGAGKTMFLAIVKHLIPYIKEKKVVLFLNFGDHLTMFEYLQKKIADFSTITTTFFNLYAEFKKLIQTLDDQSSGIYAIYNQDIFEAVYSTNLLIPRCDLLITKPSELVFYPIPKVFMRHIGGHEVYGAIHGSEIGDATFECSDKKSICQMLDNIMNDSQILKSMIENINQLYNAGCYNGGYEAVKLAIQGIENLKK